MKSKPHKNKQASRLFAGVVIAVKRTAPGVQISSPNPLDWEAVVKPVCSVYWTSGKPAWSV